MSAAADLASLFRSSPSLADHLAALPRAAATGAPLLLLGEPGSGRSSLARAVHLASPRADGPLVEVDAGTFPASLLESELFGYRAGAFTGAERDQVGRVAQAEGGSLLLDPVEAIPPEAQAKLLRLLAESLYRPLGGEERRADVRFLAVGGDDLPRRVARGLFRPDLYYRLEVLALRVPPLRERRDDLPVLAAAVVADLAARLGRRAPALAPAALAWMADHHWPGNLRELRNVLERALVLADEGEPLDPPPPPGLRGERSRPLVEVEADEIRRALAHTRGHQGRAAELLGISRKALWEKRRRLGIP